MTTQISDLPFAWAIGERAMMKPVFFLPNTEEPGGRAEFRERKRCDTNAEPAIF